MNPDLCEKALEKIGNPHILVNLVSKRVRQLAFGHGMMSRPLIDKPEGLELVEIALKEIADGKITWQYNEEAKKRIHEHRLK